MRSFDLSRPLRLMFVMAAVTTAAVPVLCVATAEAKSASTAPPSLSLKQAEAAVGMFAKREALASGLGTVVMAAGAETPCHRVNAHEVKCRYEATLYDQSSGDSWNCLEPYATAFTRANSRAVYVRGSWETNGYNYGCSDASQPNLG